MQPQVLDLYCSAGGVGLALDRLGVSHVGVDIEDKSDKYSGEFIQADASDINALENALVERYGEVPEFDLLWMSPPCQAYSRASVIHYENPKDHHPTFEDLNVREVLEWVDAKEYIIENVATCDDLRNPTVINGFGVNIPITNERWFETSFKCPSEVGSGTWHDSPDGLYSDTGDWYKMSEWAKVKNVPTDWTTQEIRSAIPTPFVQHLLHYCPSIEGVDAVSETKQTLLPSAAD